MLMLSNILYKCFFSEANKSTFGIFVNFHGAVDNSSSKQRTKVTRK